MKSLSPTVIAIPFFALMIGIEAFVAYRRGKAYYEAKDAVNNIFIGFVSVVFGAFFGLFIGAVYLFAYEIAPYKFPAEAWWSWALLFFIDDFAYYWFHRFSHESRLFWNFHVVHHSSEQYNLSVAVRQSWFGGIIHWIFYVPIMLIGFAPWMFALIHGLNLIYQFWIHTKLIDRLGPFEYIFNTPSHHRVHHAVNDEYIDKNYAGVLIIWDRIFGSFVNEKDEPRYGITTPLKTHNPLFANTHAWTEMFQAVRRQKDIISKIKCIFGAPDMDTKQLLDNK